MLTIGQSVVVDRAGFSALLAALIETGHELVGPTVRDGAVILGPVSGIDDLPRGIGDEQAPGYYRLRMRDDALFGYAAAPQSWKRELLVPRTQLVQIRRTASGVTASAPPRPERKVAFIGARACDIAAIGVQDRVLRDGPHRDDDYTARREQLFVLAVHCGAPAGTCFCVSMGSGPRARAGFDLAATELAASTASGEHRFVIEIGSEAGARLLAGIAWRAASAEDAAAALAVTDSAAARMGRTMPAGRLRDALMANLEHPRWQSVADRCLGCANCTMLCPTCFCTNIEDTTDLSGEIATRSRRWDSCFTAEYAYVHGGSVRPTLRARYRQWLTHKLATWHDQFGTSGCVGCGRCITWCPVGIDITEEAGAICAAEPRS